MRLSESRADGLVDQGRPVREGVIDIIIIGICRHMSVLFLEWTSGSTDSSSEQSLFRFFKFIAQQPS